MSGEALPRVLDVQELLDARQPEVVHHWSTIDVITNGHHTQVEALAAANARAGSQNWGAKAQPRHLRRCGALLKHGDHAAVVTDERPATCADVHRSVPMLRVPR